MRDPGTDQEYLGLGNLSAYTFDFKITSLDHLLLIQVDDDGEEVFRVRGTDAEFIETVEFDPVAGGGTVTLVDDLPADYRFILLLANDEPNQPSEFKNKFDFTLSRIESALDYLAGCIMRAYYLANRSVKLSDLDHPEDFDPTLPAGMSNAVSVIPTTNSDGTGWAEISEWTPLTDLTTAVAQAAAAAVSAAAALASQIAAAASAVASAVSAASALTSATNAATSLAAALVAQAAAEAAAAGLIAGTFNITNAMSGLVPTYMTVDALTLKYAEFWVGVDRGSGVVSQVRINLYYDGTTWTLDEGPGIGAAHGLTFTVTQVTTVASVNIAADSSGNGTGRFQRRAM